MIDTFPFSFDENTRSVSMTSLMPVVLMGRISINSFQALADLYNSMLFCGTYNVGILFI